MSTLVPGCCVDRRYGDGCTAATCMRLADGKTCGDCTHQQHCAALYGKQPSDTTCDFFPRRFRLVEGV